MTVNEIRQDLLQLQDVPYRELQLKLIPSVDPASVIGIRTPLLRRYAGKLWAQKDAEAFLEALPHRYFEENQLHAFVLSGVKDYERCVALVDRFLPFVDNWATCDQMSPRVFKKRRAELLGPIQKWLASEHVYAVRFAIKLLMEHFLDEDFDIAYPEMVAEIRSEEYYVNMMIAWYFATALAKQYEAALPFIKDGRLAPWTHNKAIQKAIESYRVSPERKDFLRGLKVKRVRGGDKA